MNCPKCGRPEKKVRVCSGCGVAFASEDLQAFRQLEYLLVQTAGWDGVEEKLTPYRNERRALRARLNRVMLPEVAPETPSIPVPPPAAVAATPIVAKPSPRAASKATPAEPVEASVPVESVAPVAPAVLVEAPPKEKVPFDEWLLSERNIKIALYGGGLLLFIAGIIFVGINWYRLPGPVKFAITLMITGLTALGGYLLYKRPSYRLGGVALLGLSCGFLTLNFAVLQIYVMGPEGLPADVMWLIASPFCLVAYYVIAFWTRHELFSYITIAALASLVSAALVVADAQLILFGLAGALFALLLLGLAILFKGSSLADFAYRPTLFVSHGAMPLSILFTLAIWAINFDCSSCGDGTPWIALPVLMAGVLFYALNAFWQRQELFTFAGIAVLTLFLATLLLLLEAQDFIADLIFALFALALLSVALIGRQSTMADIVHRPFLYVAHGLMPLTLLLTLPLLAATSDCSSNCSSGSPWLAIASMFVGVVFYAVNAYWKREEIFTYAGIGVLTIALAGSVFLAEVDLVVAALLSGFYSLILLVVALRVKGSSLAGIAYEPFLITSQGFMPLAMLFALTLWIINTICTTCTVGSGWIPLLALGFGVTFYAITSLNLKWLWARWAAVGLFSMAAFLVLLEIGLDMTIAGFILMFLALVELLTGQWVQKREGALWGALPFYVPAAGLALLVTLLALDEPVSLIQVLFGDVILLSVAAWIFQDYRWAYGAVWLFILPTYLLIVHNGSEYAYRGLLMGLLGLNYVVAGYVLGRREKRLGWPFLSAAAFLSLLVTGLTWPEPWIFVLSMAAIASVYVLMALWLKWPWLMLPALLAVDLFILGLNRGVYELAKPLEPALIISYGLSGCLLLVGGLLLRRRAHTLWAVALYLFGVLDLGLAYGTGLLVGGWLAVGLSAVTAVFLLAFSWLEREQIESMKLPPILTYLGTGIIYLGSFFLIYTLGGMLALETWPAYVAGLCALFVGLGWLLRRNLLGTIYGTPLRYTGLALVTLPLFGVLVYRDPVIGAITYAIAGIIFAAEALLRRILVMAYLSAGAFIVVIWAVLMALEVSELLAYVTPLSLGLLGLGWSEHIQGRITSYMLPTLAGLLTLMGATFYQSVVHPHSYYWLLLLLESGLAIAWGMMKEVRCYIQVAGLAIGANALYQLIPLFWQLDRWIQIAITGGLLLGAGLLALFRRETILHARQRATGEWRRFDQ